MGRVVSLAVMRERNVTVGRKLAELCRIACALQEAIEAADEEVINDIVAGKVGNCPERWTGKPDGLPTSCYLMVREVIALLDKIEVVDLDDAE